MNFKIFNKRTKILFLLTIIFLIVSVVMFIIFLATTMSLGNHYFWIFAWFATASTILFHYLLWKNLPFLQSINLEYTSNYTIVFSLIAYVCLFPIILCLTVTFLLIFAIAIFVTIIINFFHREPKIEY